MLIMPVFSFALGPLGLVPCSNTPDASGNIPAADACGFAQIMALVNTVVKFILFNMVIPIAAIMMAYAGFILVTAGGESASKKTKAKEIFTNAVIGLVISAACYLIIHTLLSILGYNATWLGF